jgi:hypothetical protein
MSSPPAFRFFGFRVQGSGPRSYALASHVAETTKDIETVSLGGIPTLSMNSFQQHNGGRVLGV